MKLQGRCLQRSSMEYEAAPRCAQPSPGIRSEASGGPRAAAGGAVVALASAMVALIIGQLQQL
jgi:hypothetical protein